MNTQHPSRIRSRAKIIAAIAGLPPAIQGKICADRRKLAEFKAAAWNSAKARKIIVELSCADAQTILPNESP